jgi:hypothetical protein
MHASGESDVNQVGAAAERLAVTLPSAQFAKVTLFLLSRAQLRREVTVLKRHRQM